MNKLFLLCIVLLLPACRGYQLRGTVVDGYHPSISMTTPGIFVVNANDPRLDTPGLPGATVSLMLDPNDLNAKDAGDAATDASGKFALPVGHGAGVLMYDAMIIAQRPDHVTAQTITALPGANKRLLIVLPPGIDNYKPRTDFVDETMEMGKPYLEGGR